MVNVRGFARLGTIAVGLGIGAAAAQSPVASADTSSNWWSSIESLLAGGTLPAETTSTLDYQISFDGYDLFPTTGNLATATTDPGDFGLAIAFGDGASANADGGNGNVAIDIGNNSGTSDQIVAGIGNGNTAIDIGNNDGLSVQTVADEGNGNTAIAIGTNNDALADEGNNNFAEVIGPQNSAAGAFDGDHNIAYVLDPFGSTASNAFSGDSNYDLAAVLLTDGHASATGMSDFLYDIISSLGHETGALPF